MIGRCKRNGTGRKPQKPKNYVTQSSEQNVTPSRSSIQSHCSNNNDLTTRRESQENVGELKSLFERMSKSPAEIKTRYVIPRSHHHGQPRLAVVDSR